MGKCKLGWLKSSKSPNPKSPYLTLEWKKNFKINVEWALSDDQSINKVHTKGYPSRKLFNIHVKRKKISIQQKMTKIGTFENKVQVWSFKSA
jgi:hypothetical protein